MNKPSSPGRTDRDLRNPMEAEKLVNIHLQIEGYTIPLKVKSSEEKRYRDAARQVAGLINEYRNAYQRKLATKQFDTPYILVMVAFQFAVGAIGASEEEAKAPILDRIEGYTREIETLLADAEETGK